MEIYDKIYDVSKKHMIESDMDFSFSKESFKSILYVNPYVIDINEFLFLSDNDFINAVYLRFLNRLPDQSSLSSYYNRVYKSNADSELIRYGILLSVMYSPEFKDKGKDVNNLIELEKKLINKSKFTILRLILIKYTVVIRGGILKCIVIPTWNSFPPNLQSIIRKKILIHQNNKQR